MTVPEGQTPSAPDNDTPDDGTHDGRPDDLAGTGRTPSAPDNDTPDDGTHAGS